MMKRISNRKSFSDRWKRVDSTVLNLSGVKVITPSKSICLTCKGGRMLCGKPYCFILSKAESLVKHLKMIDSTKVEGSSPPGIFVGRFGYPKVYAGPMIPPFRGDTSILDNPEEWIGKSFQEIINYRYSLIRGKQLLDVKEATDPGRFLSNLQEVSMAREPVDSEAILKKKPSNTLILSEFSQPFGPSALLRDYQIESIKTDHKIEKVFYDTDLLASKAIMKLYRDDASVTQIQRCLTAGILGVKNQRKLVPTRWAITAVDDTVSRELLRDVKENPIINEYRIYVFKNLGNIFTALLYPSRWEFEWIEAWFPGTTWNTIGSEPELIGDHEFFQGRTKYADEIGGCYYAARLGVSETFSKWQRQSGVLVLREIHPGYIFPVGVWNVRESVRRLMKMPYESFSNVHDAVKYLMDKLTVNSRMWLSKSRLLHKILVQRKLDHFM